MTNLTAAGNSTLLAILGRTVTARVDALYNTTLAMHELATGLLSLPPFSPIVLGPLQSPTGGFKDSVTELLVTDHYIAYTDSPMSKEAILDVSRYKFLEIGFHFCTKTVAREVKQGVSATREVASNARIVNGPRLALNYNWQPSFYGCYLAGSCNKTIGGLRAELEAPSGEKTPEVYLVDVWTSLVSSNLISSTMYDAVLLDSNRGTLGSNGGGTAEALAHPLLGDFLVGDGPFSPEGQMEGVRNVTRNMAQSMTNL